MHILFRRSLLTPAAATLALLVALLLAAPATAAPDWADADTATIHPGVQMVTDGAQCTANFVFTASSGDVLLGYAAHCAGTGAATSTNGCETESLPVGSTQVEIDGASQPGTLVYSSWSTMQDRDEGDDNACFGNDFALVRIHADDVASVNPSVPFWGGPQGVYTDGNVPVGDRVYSYGNSSLRPTDSPLSRKEGYTVSSTNGGWTHTVYTTSPGIPGDSGSAYLDADGQALGVLSTLAIAPLTGSNNISDIGKAMDYARSFGPSAVSGLTLADGTEPFDPGLGTPIG